MNAYAFFGWILFFGLLIVALGVCIDSLIRFIHEKRDPFDTNTYKADMRRRFGLTEDISKLNPSEILDKIYEDDINAPD